MNKKEKIWMSYENTTAIRGLASLLIVLVHIPSEYGNMIQYMVSRFGFICVTFFFLFSGYGCLYGLHKKNDYLKGFWKNRLLAMFIPAIIINVIIFLIKFLCFDQYDFRGLLDFNSYIYTMIFIYAVFWFTFRYISGSDKKSILLISIVVFISSMVTEITGIVFPVGWSVERMGFIYGLVIFVYFDQIKSFIKEHYAIWLLVSFAGSLIMGIIRLKNKNAFGLGDFYIKLALGFFLVVFALLVSYYISPYNKATFFLGKIAFEIYLTHVLIIKILSYRNLQISSVLYIIIVYTLSIPLAWISHVLAGRLISKIKG